MRYTNRAPREEHKEVAKYEWFLVKIHSAKEKLGIFRSLCGFAVNYP